MKRLFALIISDILPNIRNLNVSSCPGVIDNALFFLHSLEKLQSLNIMHCYNLTDQGVNVLQNMENLQQINIKGLNKLSVQVILNLIKRVKNIKLDNHQFRMIMNKVVWTKN